MRSLIAFVRNEMEAYRLYTVVPRLVKFIDSLTNVYVRYNRKRLKGGKSSEDCLFALTSLHTVLLDLCKVRNSSNDLTSFRVFRYLLCLGNPYSYQVRDQTNDVLAPCWCTFICRILSIEYLVNHALWSSWKSLCCQKKSPQRWYTGDTHTLFIVWFPMLAWQKEVLLVGFPFKFKKRVQPKSNYPSHVHRTPKNKGQENFGTSELLSLIHPSLDSQTFNREYKLPLLGIP